MISTTIPLNNIFTFNNAFAFDKFSTRKLKYSSNSSVESFDKLIDIEKEKIIAQKFLNLKSLIGEKLFEESSYQDSIFMVETANSIDFGHSIDLEKISQEIKNHDIF